jgi:endonuclease YncB( thermonuclease family)
VTSCVNLVMVSQKWAVEKYRELQEKYPEYLEYTEEE